MKNWSSINQLRSVVKHVRHEHDYHATASIYPTLSFRGTVKLHGTNAGIRRRGDTFIAQSRSSELSIGNDNYAFAHFVANIPTQQLHDLFDKICSDRDIDITIFGEWIGPGIQKIVGVSELEHRQFVVFGSYNHEMDVYLDNRLAIQNHSLSIYNVLEVPPIIIAIDFNDPQPAVELITAATLEYEEKCPWAAMFGINGIGEGLVWQCVDNLSSSGLWFKTKGTKHASGSKTKNKAVTTISVEKMESIAALTNYVLTDARLNQGLEHVALDIKNVGPYLKWISSDIVKEETDTIVESGLTWKEVAKSINIGARRFFIDRCNTM